MVRAVMKIATTGLLAVWMMSSTFQVTVWYSRESALVAHEAVAEAAVVGMRMTSRDRICTFVTLQADVAESEDCVRGTGQLGA